jgi:hypothetical protein
MNIVPFIIGLLMIFAIITNTLLNKKVSDDIVSKSISGYMKASRKALNASEDFYFNNLKAKPSLKEQKYKKLNDQEQEPKTREINIENAKINIYQLAIDKENQIQLYDIIASLIKTLYCKKKFYTPNLEKNLLNNVIYALENQIKKNKKTNLASLILKDFSLQKIYYKILKGTKFYDFDENIGTASLLDFIKIENSNEKIPMKDASKELLTALFNKKIVTEIMLLQKENPPKNITEENIITICQKHHFLIDKKILDFFDFSNSLIKVKEKIIVGLDKDTNIKVKRKITI